MLLGRRVVAAAEDAVAGDLVVGGRSASGSSVSCGVGRISFSGAASDGMSVASGIGAAGAGAGRGSLGMGRDASNDGRGFVLDFSTASRCSTGQNARGPEDTAWRTRSTSCTTSSTRSSVAASEVWNRCLLLSVRRRGMELGHVLRTWTRAEDRPAPRPQPSSVVGARMRSSARRTPVSSLVGGYGGRRTRPTAVACSAVFLCVSGLTCHSSGLSTSSWRRLTSRMRLMRSCAGFVFMAEVRRTGAEFWAEQRALSSSTRHGP